MIITTIEDYDSDKSGAIEFSDEGRVFVLTEKAAENTTVAKLIEILKETRVDKDTHAILK